MFSLLFNVNKSTFSQFRTTTSNTVEQEKAETYNNTIITTLQKSTSSKLTALREGRQVFSRNKSLTNADIVELLAKSGKPLPIVHCSAGIGRTGDKQVICEI
jgi:protein tyrosine phosphatase